MSNNPCPPDIMIMAQKILRPFAKFLDHTAPERTIHQLREAFLKLPEGYQLNQFTDALRYLLERRYLVRLNDERLELSSSGREFLHADDFEKDETSSTSET